MALWLAALDQTIQHNKLEKETHTKKKENLLTNTKQKQYKPKAEANLIS